MWRCEIPESKIKEIADNADLIVAGYSFTLTEDGKIRVLNLNNTDEACVLDMDGSMLETSMDDNTLCMVQGYFLKNRELLEVSRA